jgi:hypothetical protein
MPVPSVIVLVAPAQAPSRLNVSAQDSANQHDSNPAASAACTAATMSFGVPPLEISTPVRSTHSSGAPSSKDH